MVKSEVENAVNRSVRVPVPVERAFPLFLERMSTWWPAGHHIGSQPFEEIVVEPFCGGRWFERDAQGNECEWGRVLAWTPPNRVLFAWHLGPRWTFDPDPNRASELEIRFTADGPSATLVELQHSYFERHGEGHERMREALQTPGAWTGILEAFAKGIASE